MHSSIAKPALDSGRSGLLYVGNLHIEIVNGTWDPDALLNGVFQLTIGNASRQSDDLSALEADLYAFGVSEGYVTP